MCEGGKIADDVKALDQPARASLRKYGVRFGAYHIYVPALLKPAPRALATQLYALKHDTLEGASLVAWATEDGSMILNTVENVIAGLEAPRSSNGSAANERATA